ncbi:MAG: hypothetical protein QN178_12205 [Armatimonadota bacterium]|nr:hypothetical protein [Armatimonadota bacterium]
MLESRRHILDVLRAGPALFVGLPGDEVDMDRLAVHLAERGIDGGIYATDGSLEGLLWIQQGEPGDTWFFEAGGQEAVLPVATSRDLLLDIASRGGTISVFVGSPSGGTSSSLTTSHALPRFMFTDGPQVAQEPRGMVYETVGQFEPVAAREVSEPAPDRMSDNLSRALETSGVVAPQVPNAESPTADPDDAAIGGEAVIEPTPSATALDAAGPTIEVEPPAHPWSEILAEMSTRIVRHRGPKLAAQFSAALQKALAEHGGRVQGDAVIAPPLPESTWRVVVEAACAPVVAVAGRAFVDRTIAAAERAVLEARGSQGADA